MEDSEVKPEENKEVVEEKEGEMEKKEREENELKEKEEREAKEKEERKKKEIEDREKKEVAEKEAKEKQEKEKKAKEEKERIEKKEEEKLEKEEQEKKKQAEKEKKEKEEREKREAEEKEKEEEQEKKEKEEKEKELIKEKKEEKVPTTKEELVVVDKGQSKKDAKDEKGKPVKETVVIKEKKGKQLPKEAKTEKEKTGKENTVIKEKKEKKSTKLETSEVELIDIDLSKSDKKEAKVEKGKTRKKIVVEDKKEKKSTKVGATEEELIVIDGSYDDKKEGKTEKGKTEKKKVSSDLKKGKKSLKVEATEEELIVIDEKKDKSIELVEKKEVIPEKDKKPILKVFKLKKKDFRYTVVGRGIQRHYITFKKVHKQRNLEWLRANPCWKSVDGICKMEASEVTIKHKYHRKGIKLAFFRLKLEKKKKMNALCFLIHGFGSHTLSDTRHFGNDWAENGIEVIGYDQENHGKSCPPKEFGKFGSPGGYIYNYKSLVLNTIEFIKFILYESKDKERYAGIPIFLWGQSMGGITALSTYQYLRKKNDTLVGRIKGVVVCDPAIEPKAKPAPVFRCMFNLVNVFMSGYKGPESWGGKSTPNTQIEEEHIAYRTDPLTQKGPMHVGSCCAILDLGDSVMKSSLYRFKVPILTFMGSNDNMVRKSAVDRFMYQISSRDKTYFTFDTCRHDLTSELGAQVMSQVSLEWMWRHKDVDQNILT